MKSIHHLIVWFLLLILPAVGAAQESENKANQKSVARSVKLENIEVIQGVFALVDRASQFKNTALRVRTQTELSVLLWRYDETYARELFLRVYDSLKGADPKSNTSTSTAEDQEKIRLALLSWMITKVAPLDSVLAKRLSENQADDKSNTKAAAKTSLTTAYKLVETDPKIASEFAERSFNLELSPHAFALLNELRKKNESAANSLFLKSMDIAVMQPFFDANTLMWLGLYVLTSPLRTLTPDQVDMVQIGALTVPNISVVRSNTRPEILRAYLLTAINILTRDCSVEQRTLYYVTCYQLFPIVERFLPQYSYRLASAMNSLIRDVPPELVQESSFKKLAQKDRTIDIEEAIKELDNTVAESYHDQRALAIGYDLYVDNKLDGALNIFERIKDLALRKHLLSLVTYAEGMRAIELGDLHTAAKIADTRLDPSIEKTMLWLGIAAKHVQKRAWSSARESLDKAWAESLRLEEPRRPILLMIVASELSTFDLLLAGQALQQAVRAFNETADASSSRVQWVTTVKAGNLSRGFPLQPKGVDYSLHALLKPLVLKDREVTTIEFLKIKDEEMLSEGFLALAELRLSGLIRE